MAASICSKHSHTKCLKFIVDNANVCSESRGGSDVWWRYQGKDFGTSVLRRWRESFTHISQSPETKMNRRYEVPEKKLPFDDSVSILSWADSEGSIRTSPYAVYHKVHTSNLHLPPLPPHEEMYSSEIYLMQPDSVTYSESLPPKDMSIYSVPEQRKSRTCCRRLGKVFGGLLLTLNFAVCTVLAIQMFFQHRLVCNQLYYQNNTCSNCPRYECPELATSAPTKGQLLI